MPTLKQISCSIEIGTSNAKLKEYGTRYSDGHVETFIAVPRADICFTVHLRSEGYIAPGLAFFTFMDGQYQCNRNRVCLKLPGEGVTPSAYETEFRLRQKEEKTGSGSFTVREWTFAKLDRVAADKAPNLNPQFTNNVGTIEIIVLRCKAEFDGPPPRRSSQTRDKTKPIAPAKSVKRSAVPARTKSPVPASSALGGLAGLSDGTCDITGLDGTEDERPAQLNGKLKPVASPGMVWESTFRKFVQASRAGGLLRPDAAIDRNVEDRPHDHAAGPCDPGSECDEQHWGVSNQRRDRVGDDVLSDKYIGLRTEDTDGCKQHMRPVENVVSEAPKFRKADAVDCATKEAEQNPCERYDRRYDKYQNPHGGDGTKVGWEQVGAGTWNGNGLATWHNGPGARANNTGIAGTGYRWDQGRNDTHVGWGQVTHNWESMSKMNNECGGDNADQQKADSNPGWAKLGEDTGWDNAGNNNNWLGGWGRTGSQNNRIDGWANDDNQNGQTNIWDKAASQKTFEHGFNSQSGQQNNGWGNASRKNSQAGGWATQNDENQGCDARSGNNKPAGNEWAAQSQQCNRPVSKQTTRSDQIADVKSYVKPYWKEWNIASSQSELAGQKKYQQPREVYNYPASPLPPMPKNKAKDATHGVQTSKGADYTHKCRRPTYIDTMEKPYAVFSFKYRSKEALERILNLRIDDGDVRRIEQQAEMDKLMQMPKHKLIDELMKRRGLPRSQKAASGVAGEANNNAWGAASARNEGGSQANGWAKASSHGNNNGGGGWDNANNDNKGAWGNGWVENNDNQQGHNGWGANKSQQNNNRGRITPANDGWLNAPANNAWYNPPANNGWAKASGNKCGWDGQDEVKHRPSTEQKDQMFATPDFPGINMPGAGPPSEAKTFEHFGGRKDGVVDATFW